MADHQPTPETPVAPVPRRRPMLIAVLPRADDPVCRPAEELRRLLDAGALRHFVEESAKQADANDGLGNCHNATGALMADHGQGCRLLAMVHGHCGAVGRAQLVGAGWLGH
jgi:hypothetical protein